jgi:hypothetical protein
MAEGQDPEGAGADEKLKAIRSLMAASTDRHDERRILAILEAATAGELELILGALDLRALIDTVDDRLVGPDNRTELLALLTDRRAGDLSIGARAALIAALQRGSTSDACERAIRNLLLATRGAALTELKAALDKGGSYRDLHQLLFHDIDNAIWREEILDHFKAEAIALADRSSELKVLSDIDDTFYANWKDTRFPPKTIYPGVLQLYSELDRGAGDEPGRPGDITFVTARPGDRLGLVEGATHKALRERGMPASTILAGSFLRIVTNRAIAEKKLDNFLQYCRVYPEYSFVFIGDSGQGDVFFGERMLEAAPDAVRGIFIHDVVSTPEPAREELRRKRVYFFDTYAGAALETYRLGLIQRVGMARVAAAAAAEIKAIGFASEAQRQARFEELKRDIDRANAELPGEERVAFP